MALLRNVILAATLLLGAVTAQKCPDGSEPTDILGAVICCPGDVEWNSPSDIKCCVHPSGDSCQTLIPISAPGYTSIVYGATPAAANKVAAATTFATTTSAGMSSSSTSTFTSTFTSTTPLSSGSVSGISSPVVAANTVVSSSSVGGAVAAAARITAAPVLMGAAAVVLGAM